MNITSYIQLESFEEENRDSSVRIEFSEIDFYRFQMQESESHERQNLGIDEKLDYGENRFPAKITVSQRGKFKTSKVDFFY